MPASVRVSLAVAPVLTVFALAASPALLGQSVPLPEVPLAGVRHIVGLDTVQSQRFGKLSLQNGALRFDAGNSQATIPVTSIVGVFIGSEATQSNHKGGRTLEYVALVAPYYSGRAISAMTRTHVDILTLLYLDSNNGLHSAILSLPKETAATMRMRLIGAGAHNAAPSAGVQPPPGSQQPSQSKLQHLQAIQIEPPDAGNISIPVEFRYAIYERLIERVRNGAKFQKVFRSGDREANSVADLVVLRATLSRFKEGGETKRELTMVAGGTVVDVNAAVSQRDGTVLLSKNVQGRVLYFGENLGVANDVAKRLTKTLDQNF